MQYRDPIAGKVVRRSTGIERTDRKRERNDAERVAAKWEAELREGRYKPKSHISWPEFRERYESEVLTGLAEKTAKKSDVVQNSIERILNPQRLSDLAPARLSHYQAKLREGGCTESTIDGYLAHLLAALKWAVVVGMLPAVRKSSGRSGRENPAP